MNDQIELRHWRYFLAVAEELHFKKAAEKLFISQPGLSKQIQQLENHLQLKLFDRHNRKVLLTPTGKFLQKEINTLLLQFENTIQQAQLLHQGFTGNLKFGYVGSAMQDVIPKFLVDIRAHFPKVLFDLKEMDNQQQINSILNQEIDFGFVRLEHVPKEVEIHPVFEDTFSLVLPNNHPILELGFESLSQLKDAPFILFDAGYSQTYYNKVMQIFEDSGFQPIIAHKTIHAHTIYRLVENNFGVSIVPTSLQKGYQMNIQFIELKDLPHRTTLQIIWNSKNGNPVLEKVLELGSV